MRPRILLSVAGLTLGAALSVLPQPAMAITSFFGNGTCIALCINLYNSCVAQRGLNNGCGRERANCFRFCQEGTL